MIVAVVVGGAVVLLSMLLFGPFGLFLALAGAILIGSIQNGSWTTISEKDREHARQVDIDMGWRKEEK